MRIGYVQVAPEFGAVEENLARADRLLAEAGSADLWVLPELFATGYQFTRPAEVTALAEPIPGGRVTRFLLRAARERSCHLVAGLAERGRDGRVYNSAVLVGPDGVVARYRKAHLFYKEKLWFTPGDGPFTVVDIGPARVGMMICFDHLFPEAARSLALAGADVIAHPANLVVPEYGQLTMRVRALENGVFTVTANRVGTERRGGEALRFTGESQIISPRGDILARGPRDKEEVRSVDVDPVEARDKSINPYNDRLADRRPELYRT